MQELVIVVKIPSEMKRNNRIVATVTPQDVVEGVTFFGDSRILQTGALVKEKISVRSTEETQLIDASSDHVYNEIEVEPVSLQTITMDAPVEDTILEPSIGYDGIKRVNIKGLPSTFMNVSPNSSFAEIVTVTPKKYKQIISRAEGKYIDKVVVEPVVEKEEPEHSKVIMSLQETTYWEGGDENYFPIPLSAESVQGNSLIPCQYLGVVAGKDVHKVKVSGRLIFSKLDNHAMAGLIGADKRYINYSNDLLDEVYDQNCAIEVRNNVERFEDSENVAIDIPSTVLDLGSKEYRLIRLVAFASDAVRVLSCRQDHPNDKTYMIVEAIED